MTPLRRLLPFVLLGVLATSARSQDAVNVHKYLPNQTEAVVTLNVKQLCATPFVKDNLTVLKQALQTLNVGQMVAGQLGLDPFQDVERVLLASTGNPDQAGTVVLIQGSFDAAKVTAALDKCAADNKDRVRIFHIATVVTPAHPVYEIRLDREADTPYLVAVLDRGLVAISTTQALIVEALDRKSGKRPAELRQDVQQLLSRTDPQHVLSVVSLSRPLGFAGLLGNVPANLRNVSGGVAVGDDIKLDLALSAHDVQNAKAVAGQLQDRLNHAKAFVAVLVTQKKELAPVADLLAGVRVSAKGNDVAVRLTVSKELIDSFFKKEP